LDVTNQGTFLAWLYKITETIEGFLQRENLRERRRFSSKLAAIVAVHFGFDLKQCVRAMLRGDYHKLSAVRVTAIYFVQTTRRIASPADNGSTGKNVVHERSGLGAVEQTGPRLSFHSNSHNPIFFIDAGRDQTRNGRSNGRS
jgi:hypothetical protein